MRKTKTCYAGCKGGGRAYRSGSVLLSHILLRVNLVLLAGASHLFPTAERTDRPTIEARRMDMLLAGKNIYVGSYYLASYIIGSYHPRVRNKGSL